jgi:Zn-dependent M28 family amino/carboxypeptidase
MKTRKLTLLIAALLLATAGVIAQQQELDPSPERLQQHVSYLASEALDGRRTGTTGATDAARYIAGEFARLGLRPASQTGKGSRRLSDTMVRYLQTFPYVGRVTLGKANALSYRSGSSVSNLQVGQDWMPLSFSSNQKIEKAEIVFAGHGITASELNHNDYPGKYTKNQVAIVFAGTPDGDNPHGRFTRAGEVRFKVAAARNAGVGALLIIASENNLKDDRLSQLRYDNAGEADIPVLVISRQAAAQILGGPGATLEALKSVPDSQKLKATTLDITTDVVREDVPAYNVIGVLEGSDPVLKNENIIIGAHYDHLGRGGEGSLAPRSGEIHHGADDNASGTAGLIELARIFSAQQPKLKRTVIFIAFGGEEEGLLGSSYYVDHPVAPLANTVAMINMDMIGRMKDRKLVIGGVGTATEWKQLISQANAAQSMKITANSGSPAVKGVPIVVSANGRPIMTVDPNGTFDLTLNEDGYGPSDHSSFYKKQIPVLFFWTGTHSDYHKPSDTFDKINYNDEARILALVARIVRDVDSADKRPTYAAAKSDAIPRTGGFRVYLGTIPNYADSTDGLLIDGVRDDSPAAKAGIKTGDRIVKIGTRDVKNVYDYTFALGEMKAGQEYVVEVMRGGEKLVLKVTPEARK